MLPPSMRSIVRKGHPFATVNERHLDLAARLVHEGYSFVGMMQKHLEAVSNLILAAEGLTWVMPDDESVAGILALDSEQNIVGVAIFGAWGKNGSFFVHLQHLSVSEHARGKGIGSVLTGMGRHVTHRDASMTYAGIEPTPATFRFYQRVGFDIQFPNEPIFFDGVPVLNNNPRFTCWATRPW